MTSANEKETCYECNNVRGVPQTYMKHCYTCNVKASPIVSYSPSHAKSQMTNNGKNINVSHKNLKRVMLCIKHCYIDNHHIPPLPKQKL